MVTNLPAFERLAARSAQRHEASAHLVDVTRELAPLAVAGALNTATAAAFERIRHAQAAASYAAVPDCPGVLARKHSTGDGLRLLLPVHEAGLAQGFEAAHALGASARQLSTDLLSFNRDAPFMHGALASFAVLCAPEKDRDWLTLRGAALAGFAPDVAAVRVAGPCVVDGVTHLAVDVDYRRADGWHGLTQADVISSADLKGIVFDTKRVAHALQAPIVAMLSDPVFRVAFDEMLATYLRFLVERCALTWGGCTMASYAGPMRRVWLELGNGRPVDPPAEVVPGELGVYHPDRVLDVLEDPRVPFLDRLGLLNSPHLETSLGKLPRMTSGKLVLDVSSLGAVSDSVGLLPLKEAYPDALAFCGHQFFSLATL